MEGAAALLDAWCEDECTKGAAFCTTFCESDVPSEGADSAISTSDRAFMHMTRPARVSTDCSAASALSKASNASSILVSSVHPIPSMKVFSHRLGGVTGVRGAFNSINDDAAICALSRRIKARGGGAATSKPRGSSGIERSNILASGGEYNAEPDALSGACGTRP